MSNDHKFEEGKIVTRFAPSPTGHLHLGGARTAIFNWLLSRHYKGKFYLRIEDTDQQRSKQEYTDSILASMQWLGLDWDGELTYQTQRMARYVECAHEMFKRGAAYWCDCTPEEVEAMREQARALGQKPRYNGKCRERNLGPGQGHCLRLRLPDYGKVIFNDMIKGTIATDIQELDDMVLLRADGFPTYNLAVVVDDHDMGITHVIRGDDHVSNTPRQILIYQALGFAVPEFGHVPMILGQDRQKLSKRHGARAVIEYKEDGLLPEALCSALVRLGWSHGDQELFTLNELVEFFDGANLNPSSAAFDPAKLTWTNAQFLQNMDLAKLSPLAKPFLQKEAKSELSLEQVQRLCELFRQRSDTLCSLAEQVKPMLCEAKELVFDQKAVTKNLTAETKAHLSNFAQYLENISDFSVENLDQAFNTWLNEVNIKLKLVAPALRTALMGKMTGPHLPEIMNFLGKEETLARINNAATMPE